MYPFNSNSPSAIRSNRAESQTTSTTEVALKAVDSEFDQIVTLLNSSPVGETEVYVACKQYLGQITYYPPPDMTNLAPEVFQQRKTALLELALELHFNKNESGARLIGEGIHHPHISHVDPEVEFYRHTLHDADEVRVFETQILRNAADSGRKVAQYVVGLLFLGGQDRNLSLAKRYLTLSAEQKYQPAIDALIDLPETPYQKAHRIGKTDSVKAHKLYVEAAKEGDVNALVYLGKWNLDNGNKLQAIINYRLAEKGGHKIAASRLEKLFSTMSEESACALYDNLKQLDPISIRLLGKIFLKLENTTKALACFDMSGHEGIKLELGDTCALRYRKSTIKRLSSEWYEKAIAFYAQAGTPEATLKSLEFQATYKDNNAR